LNPILVDPHRVDPLRKKAASVGVDEPEYPLALGHPEMSARPNMAVFNTITLLGSRRLS
jgi:hypothetical protein